MATITAPTIPITKAPAIVQFIGEQFDEHPVKTTELLVELPITVVLVLAVTVTEGNTLCVIVVDVIPIGGVQALAIPLVITSPARVPV
jgi:hypothetical protein